MAEYIERETLAEEIRVALSCAENRRMRSAGLSVDFDKIRNEERMMFLSRVMRAPAADVVEVVHAHWVVAVGYHPRKTVGCSSCKLLTYEPTKYCPHCGARMG